MDGEGKQTGKGKCAAFFTVLFLAAAVALGICGLITSNWIEARLGNQRERAGLWEKCPKGGAIVIPEPEPENNTTSAPEPEPTGIPEPFDGTCDIFVVESFNTLEPWFVACLIIATVGVAFSVLALFISLGTCCLSRNKPLHVFLMVAALFAGMLLFITVALYGANANPTTGTYLFARATQASVNFGYSYFVMIGACFANIIGGICTQLTMQGRFD